MYVTNCFWVLPQLILNWTKMNRETKKGFCPFVCLQTIESRKIFWSTTIKPIEVFLCQRIFSLAPFSLLLAPLARLCRQRRSSSPWSSLSPLCHHHHHRNHHNRLWQVSWIRRRENEMSLLTTDRLVFSADNRYSVVQVPNKQPTKRCKDVITVGGVFFPPFWVCHFWTEVEPFFPALQAIPIILSLSEEVWAWSFWLQWMHFQFQMWNKSESFDQQRSARCGKWIAIQLNSASKAAALNSAPTDTNQCYRVSAANKLTSNWKIEFSWIEK